MAPPHIISWGGDERSVSPVSTTTTSVVSIDSIPSNTSSTVPEASRTTQSQVSFPVFLGNRAPGLHLANDDPFMRHDKYYFKDGNITFLVRPCSIVCSLGLLFYPRSTAHFTVSIDTSFLVIQLTSPLGLASLAFESTKPYPSSYRWEMWSARILRLSFLSCIPSELDSPICLPV